MSLASEITRIANLRNTIRSKLIALGIISDSSANLSACTTAISGINTLSLTTPTIAISPTLSLNSTTGVVTASGSAYGTVTAGKGYSNGSVSASVPVSASSTLQLTVYDGTIS